MDTSQKERRISLSEIVMYFALLTKHVRLIVLLMTLSLAVGLTYFVYAKPVYYCRALVNYRSLRLPVDTEHVFNDSNYLTILKDMMAPHILLRTANRLGYDGTYLNLERNYLRRVVVKFNEQRNIEIEVWPYVASWAKAWPETMFEEYLAYRDEQRIKYRDGAMKAYAFEMEGISARMEKVLAERFNLKDTNEVTLAQIELNKFRSIPQRLALISYRLAERDLVRKSIQNPAMDLVSKLSIITTANDGMKLDIGQIVSQNSFAQVGGPRTPGPAATSDRPAQIVVLPEMVDGAGVNRRWPDLDKERRRALELRKEYDRVYLSANPKMMALDKKIAALDRELQAEYESAKNRFDLEYAGLLDQQRELQEKLPDYERANRRYEKVNQDTAKFDSGQLAWQTMYAELAKQLTTFDFGGQKERVHMNYSGIAEIRDVIPVSPNRFKLILISLGFGLMLAIGVPFLIEYLDFTVSDVGQAEGLLAMRGLGIIPKVMRGQSESLALLSNREETSLHLVENFRVIRTNLLLNTGKSKIHQVIMVASAMPREGKTAISSNLALSFADKGEKTLLIDCDLRRGRQHRMFGLSASPGLSNIFLEKSPMDEALRPSGHENLDILTCGKHASGATDSLGEPVFENLLIELRQRYQRIVIDTAPVLGLAETSTMQRVIDGVVFVISSNHTPIRSVKAAVEILQGNGANFFGFILNRIDLTTSSNYYKYYYYSYQYYDNYQTAEK